MDGLFYRRTLGLTNRRLEMATIGERLYVVAATLMGTAFLGGLVTLGYTSARVLVG